MLGVACVARPIHATPVAKRNWHTNNGDDLKPMRAARGTTVDSGNHILRDNFVKLPFPKVGLDDFLGFAKAMFYSFPFRST